ncbi:hypothetical protein JOC76_001483 [Neobacillus cucumis]|nr:hypothetical protein [Neobacillus cucumis]
MISRNLSHLVNFILFLFVCNALTDFVKLLLFLFAINFLEELMPTSSSHL